MDTNARPEKTAVAIYDHLGNQLRTVHKLDTDITTIARILLKQDADRRGVQGGPVTTPFTQNPWVQAIINSIAKSLAEIPFGLHRPINRRVARRSTSAWVPIEKHPFLDLFEQPNKSQDFQKFLRHWCAIYLAHGNVWAYKDRANSTGVPRALLLFGPNHVRPIRKYIMEQPKGWRLTLPNGETEDFKLDELIHWCMPNPYDPVLGLPPWWAGRTDLDAEAARSAYDAYFFKNNATPDAVLTYKPGPLNEYAREQIYEAWAEYHKGVENVGGLAVVGGDFDIKILGVNHASSQFMDSRHWSREEIASLYDYPVALLNAQEHTGLSRDGLESARTMKYENCVIPAADNFARGITESLVHPMDRNIMAAFDYDMLPVTLTYLTEKMKIAKEMFAMGVPLNDILAKVDIGIDPVEGGDVGYVSKSLVPLKVIATLTKKDLQPAAPKGPPQGPQVSPNGNQKAAGNGKSNGKTPPKKLPAKPKTQQDVESEILRLASSNLEEMYQQKMGKFLKEMRTNTFHHPMPDDPERLDYGMKKWNRWITPVQLLSIAIGRKGNSLSAEAVSADELKKMAHKVQTAIESVTITDKDIDKTLDTLMKQSGKIVNTIIERLSRADSTNWNANVKSIFEDMNVIVPEWSRLFVSRGIKLGKENRIKLE